MAAHAGLLVIAAELAPLASLADHGYIPLRGRVRRPIGNYADGAITYVCAKHGEAVFPPRDQKFCAQFWMPRNYDDSRFVAIAAVMHVPPHASVKVNLPPVHFYTDPQGKHLRTYEVVVSGP